MGQPHVSSLRQKLHPHSRQARHRPDPLETFTEGMPDTPALEQGHHGQKQARAQELEEAGKVPVQHLGFRLLDFRTER